MRLAYLFYAAVLAAFLAPAHAQGTRDKTPTPAVYTLTDLGPMVPADDDALPRMNKDGDVSYWQLIGGKIAPTLWHDGKTIALDAPPDYQKCFTTGITDKGLIVGVAEDISMPGRIMGVQWSGKKHELTRVLMDYDPGKTFDRAHPKNTRALGANEKGVVIGSLTLPNADIHAFSLVKGKVKDLGTIAAGNYSFARAINNAGVIVGVANVTVNGSNHAAVWRDGAGQDLGLAKGGTYTQATAINERGEIAGWGNNGEAEVVSLLWKDGKRIDLGDLGGNPSAAWGLNNKGEVVGHSFIPGKPYGPPHAYLWKDGKIADLNDMIGDRAGWTLLNAYDINDRGEIVGVSSYKGIRHFFLLRPVKGR
jgi:probable HAF family extracellular repeat protein